MALAIEDVLQTNLTLIGVRLVNTPEERETFREGVQTEIVTAEAGLGGEVFERTHNLSRDRITVVSTSDRTVIVREYPAKNDLERLAQVAAMAIENTNLDGQELRAIGYNIELVCESDSKNLAIEYLAEHLFMPHLLKGDDSRLSGGAGRLFIEKSGRRWQARLEPRFNDETTTKIFASLNLHHSEASLSFPTEDDIRDSLTLVWNEVHDLLIHLDGSST